MIVGARSNGAIISETAVFVKISRAAVVRVFKELGKNFGLNMQLVAATNW